MKFHKGFYSLIQYCPDPARLEAANVGVLLFCPELKFLSAQMSSDNRRVQQFFGRTDHDWKQIRLFKDGMEERIAREATKIRTREELQLFIDSRANLIRITPPVPMRISSPNDDLRELFELLVGRRTTAAPHAPKKRFQTVVAERLRNARLGNKLTEDVPVDVPYLKKPVAFPFGFQNGRFNLIQPVSFVAEDPDDSVRKALPYAFEGESIYGHPHEKFGQLKLIVVGEFQTKQDDARATVSKILEKHHVRLVPNDQLDTLVQEISAKGKVIVA
ncbi:MAG: hypothetical protein JWP89_3165 [Schlesneria sp.]|nr:hypothetical protein [Schlesneria sp.]